ncbi:MAG TPA: DJ-1 family glyoxalase III [Gammaproteobacteria bacterium]|nr:DJ-1 family glyoxalase III [Gammaproteobacteria bacterium]
MASVLMPLAEGFEELEAITIADVLRRGGIEVVLAGLNGTGAVTGSRETRVVPDAALDDVMDREFDMITLPGGMPGVDHLKRDERIKKLIDRHQKEGRFTTAICAAPSILAAYGYLEGRQATSNPKFINQVNIGGVDYVEDPVVVDGSLVTSRGPGTAMDFGLKLVEMLAGEEARDKVEEGLVRIH